MMPRLLWRKPYKERLLTDKAYRKNSSLFLSVAKAGQPLLPC
jgi:hypothetical protein